MSWLHAGQDALRAALLIKQHPRSCVSRAYYAAYSVATDALVKSRGVAFAAGRDGPSHNELPRLVENHLRNRLGGGKIKQLKAALRRLYAGRLIADYNPEIALIPEDARIAMSDAAFVLSVLHPEER